MARWLGFVFRSRLSILVRFFSERLETTPVRVSVPERGETNCWLSRGLASNVFVSYPGQVSFNAFGEIGNGKVSQETRQSDFSFGDPDRRFLDIKSRQTALEPIGNPPVPIAEQLHHRGHENHSHQRCIEEDRDGESDPEQF